MKLQRAHCRLLTVAPTLLLLSACGGGDRDGILQHLNSSGPSPSPGVSVKATAKVPTLAAHKRIFATTDGPTVLDWSVQLVQSVAPADTSYDHGGMVAWQGVDGAAKSSSHTDCSGLINALLARSYGLTPRDFRSWLSTERPLAKDYFSAIESQHGFTQVGSVTDLRAGDLIAVRYPNSAPGDDSPDAGRRWGTGAALVEPDCAELGSVGRYRHRFGGFWTRADGHASPGPGEITRGTRAWGTASLREQLGPLDRLQLE